MKVVYIIIIVLVLALIIFLVIKQTEKNKLDKQESSLTPEVKEGRQISFVKQT